MRIVDQIVPFYMNHNSEPEAIDLVMEVDKLDKIIDVKGFN